MNKWQAVIGLEIHAQIQTQTKMFSHDSTCFNATSNSQIHPVSMGFPGTLPVLNKKVVELALQTGQAFHCEIQKKSIFARKNYFYPDLPKGYQISQFTFPLLKKGFVEFYSQNQACKIHIERIHIEEDAGRLLHYKDYSLVDFNRAGMPLMEIISYPEISSPVEATDYARMVRTILLYLGVCDGNMQEGSLRFDCNISLRPQTADEKKIFKKIKLGTKVEIKNLNSFRFIEKALKFEIKRQSSILNSGGTIQQETRLFNPQKNETFSMRSKEQASDYRYFPEPDLPPLIVENPPNLKIELPFNKIKRWHNEYGIALDSAIILAHNLDLCTYFEKAMKETKYPQTLCKWVINEIPAFLNEKKQISVSPSHLAELVNMIENKILSSKMAKDLLPKMWKTGKGAKELMKELHLRKLDDEETLSHIISQVIEQFPTQCEQYKKGKETVYKFLMGQVMKLSKGQADPLKAHALLKDKLKKL